MLKLIALGLSLLAEDGGASLGRVRMQAAVVVASSSAEPRGAKVNVLRPLERRLRSLLPYTSYKGFTEYTASLLPGDVLDLRLPDGRMAHLTPTGLAERAPPPAGEPPAQASGRSIRVAVDRGADFESRVACGQVTVFQVANGTAENQGDRTFLVYAETCPGSRPGPVVPDTP